MDTDISVIKTADCWLFFTRFTFSQRRVSGNYFSVSPECNEACLIAGIHRGNKQVISNGSVSLWLIQISQRRLDRPDTDSVSQTLQIRDLEHPKTLELDYIRHFVFSCCDSAMTNSCLLSCASLWLFIHFYQVLWLFERTKTAIQGLPYR